MIDDARLAKLLVQSGILSKDSLDALRREQTRSIPPLTLLQLVVKNGIATEARVREVVERAEQYSETTVTASRIGKFELRGELGRGGMGVVYQAWQPDLQRTVALKVIAPGAEPAFKERFLREARLASRLRHPNIVGVHEYGEEAGSAWFAMDYVKGESFDAAMKSRSIADNARLLAVIARALQHAHGQGLVHRDLKPQNILVGEDGTPFLTDFGLAREVDVRSPLTVAGQILGTPAFMSPEQARGKAEIGPASDIYSLGAVLYVVLTGVPPFRADSIYDLLDSIIKTPPPRPRTVNAAAPPALEAICLRCLEKDPAARYPTAAALAEDLETYRSGKPPAGSRKPLIFGAAAAAVVAAIAAFLLVPDPDPRPPQPPAAVDLSWMSVKTSTAGDGHAWRYPFDNRDVVKDWQLGAGVTRGSRPYEAGFEARGLRLRNAEMRFAAPIQGPGKFAVTFVPPAGAGKVGISFAGFRLVRSATSLKLFRTGEDAASLEMEGWGAAETLELELGPGWIAARVDGKEMAREPLREEAAALRPSFWIQDDAIAVFTSALVQGRIRPGWIETHRIHREELAKVGRGYRLEPVQDLMTLFKNKGAGTAVAEGTSLRFVDAGPKAVELHGPNVRNSRLRLKYAHPGGSLNLRFRAGFHEVSVPLPCGSGAAHEVVLVALEDRFRCMLDRDFDLDSSTSNGTDVEVVSIRLKAGGGGEFVLHEAQLEAIEGVAPKQPWVMLFEGNLRALTYTGTWSVRDRLLSGLGELRAEGTWTDLEAEIVLYAQKDARLTFGARGHDLLSGRPVSIYEGGFSGFNFRVENGVAELENDAAFLRCKVPDGTGPLTLRVAGTPVQVFSFRARPLK